MKSFLIILFFILSITAIYYNDQAKSVDIINTPNAIAAPHATYSSLIVLNALRAKLIKNNDQHYLLVLMHVNELVSYNKFTEHKLNKLWPLYSFIDTWKTHNENFEADVTGIQTDKRIGQTQFYATFNLTSPEYDEVNHTLYVKAELINPKINMDKSAYFDNVTIYINGESTSVN